MAPFDPYHNWLGIPPHEHPANFYRLLGLVLFESNPDVIAQAADRRSMHIGSFQNGPQGDYCAQIMGEIGQAASCLLDPQQKASYDNYLQESLSTRGERSVMAAPPPPSPFGQANPMGSSGDFNAYDTADQYSQSPMPQSMPQMNAFGQPAGEMAMPQFNLPPALGPSSAPGPMGFGPPPTSFNGMGGGMNPAPPMQNYLPSPPSPMQAQGPMQPRTMPQPQAPIPVSRGPQPAPFPKAQRPIPVAARANAPAVPAAFGGAATATPPLPPPAAPPRPADELAELAATPSRRRFFKKKRNQVPTELIIGGIVLAAGALVFVIYAASQSSSNVEKHGFDQIDAPTMPVTTAADAAAADLKKAQAAKDSAKKAAAATAANNDKKSRSVTTTGTDHPKRLKPNKPANVSTTAPGVDDSGDIESPNKFGPPAHGADDASLRTGGANNAAPNNAAPRDVHVQGPAETGDDPVMEDIIGGDVKKP